MLFRRIASIYVLYFYLISVGIISNLTITPIALSNVYSLYKCFTLTITFTLLFSN